MIYYVCPISKINSRFQRFCYPSLDQLYDINLITSSHVDTDISQQSDIFNNIIKHICINGVWKYTTPYRFKESDNALVNYLRKNNKTKYRFMDIGCSDGSTSLQTINTIRKSLNINIESFLADKYLYLYKRSINGLIEYSTTYENVVLVQIGTLGFFFGDIYSRTTGWLGNYYAKLNILRKRLKTNFRILMINPLIINRNDFHFIEMDILEHNHSLINSMDIIRASNILNTAYFSNEQIQSALHNLFTYLRDDSIIILSRNDMEINKDNEMGSIWKKENNNLINILNLGGGWELNYLINNCI